MTSLGPPQSCQGKFFGPIRCRKITIGSTSYRADGTENRQTWNDRHKQGCCVIRNIHPFHALLDRVDMISAVRCYITVQAFPSSHHYRVKNIPSGLTASSGFRMLNIPGFQRQPWKFLRHCSLTMYFLALTRRVSRSSRERTSVNDR